jgi:hypothetical protein
MHTEAIGANGSDFMLRQILERIPQLRLAGANRF